MEAFNIVKLWSIFYTPPQILDNGLLPKINSPGLLSFELPKVNGQIQRLVPKTLSIFPRPIFPRNTLHDMRWKSRTNRCGKTSAHDKNVNTCTPKTDGFLTCFREHMVPSTWRRLIHVLKKFSHGLFKAKGIKKQIRYRLLLVIIYLFLKMKLSPQP